MHRFLRAVGFSKLNNRKELQKIIKTVVQEAEDRSYTTEDGEIIIADLGKMFAKSAGIMVCGIFDEKERFIPEYCYPYLRGSCISTQEDITIERHASKESYAGVCDDIRLGVTLIFYLQNRIPYIKAKNLGQLPIRGTSLCLSALSIQGTIVMPLYKNELDKNRIKRASVNRQKLLAAARRGDENAIENLTLEDMDVYTNLSKRIHQQDVYSLVDTSFMPFGVECDQYSILAEILESQEMMNPYTKETLYFMKVSCNEVQFDLCINKEDLIGEPIPGRRFKGSIWMQGYINFPE